MLFLASCLTRKQVNAAAWLNNTDALLDLCIKVPELKDYGFYRRLDDGKIQFLSFCDPNAVRMIAFKDEDLNKILDALLPEKHE